MKKFPFSGNQFISLLVSLSYSLVYVYVGPIDLENRLTAVYSMAKKTEFSPGGSFRNLETFLGLPIFDYSLGLGTNLPLTSGLSRSNVFTSWVNLSENLFTALLLSSFLYVGILTFLSTISQLIEISIYKKLILSYLATYPFITYSLINDWPDVAISYSAVLVLISTLFSIRFQKNFLPHQDSLLGSRAILGITMLYFGQTGYFPIVIIILLAHFAIYYKIFKQLMYITIKRKKLLVAFAVLTFVYAATNLIEILLSEKSKNNQFRDSQALGISVDFLDFRQPHLLIFVISIIVIKFFGIPKLKLEITLMASILLLAWNSSSFGMLAPSSEWFIRDFFWVNLLLYLSLVEVVSHKKNTNRLTLLSAYSIVCFIYITSFVAIGNSSSFSNLNSWSKQGVSKNTQYQFLLEKELLVPGDRLLVAPSSFIRNRGEGITGLISYNDVTSVGITTLSNWSKMRDASLLIRSEKMYENRAFIEDCNLLTVNFFAPTAILLGKDLTSCIQIVEGLDFERVWENNKAILFRGNSKVLHVLNVNFTTRTLAEILNSSDCGLFDVYCNGELTKAFDSIAVKDDMGPFCKYDSKLKGWCLEFNQSSFDRKIVLPIAFEPTLRADRDLELSNAGGLTVIAIPSNFPHKIRVSYYSSDLDRAYYLTSFFLTFLLVLTAIQISLISRKVNN